VAWPMAARVAVVAGCLLPLGLCMGASSRPGCSG
jgi:hypothetical protein